jgi:hypothetical protein
MMEAETLRPILANKLAKIAALIWQATGTT